MLLLNIFMDKELFLTFASIVLIDLTLLLSFSASVLSAKCFTETNMNYSFNLPTTFICDGVLLHDCNGCHIDREDFRHRQENGEIPFPTRYYRSIIVLL